MDIVFDGTSHLNPSLMWLTRLTKYQMLWVGREVSPRVLEEVMQRDMDAAAHGVESACDCLHDSLESN